MELAFASIRAMAYRLSGMLAWALIGILTARALSIDDRGLYASAVAAIGGIGAIGSSFVSSCGYYVARRGRPPGEVAAAGGLLALGIGSLLLAVAVLTAALYTGDGRELILLVGLAILPTVARNVLSAVFLATHDLWRFNFGSHGPAYLGLACIFAWVVLLGHRSVEGALWAWLSAQYLSLGVMLVMARRWWPAAGRRPSGGLLKGLISFGTMTGLSGIVSMANARADLFMVAALDGSAGAGLYASAVAVGEGLLLFSSGISVAAYRSVGALAPGEAARLTAAGVRHTLFVVGVIGAGTFLVAPYAVELLFGARYGASANALRVLCVASVVVAPQGLLGTYFTVQRGRPSVALRLNALSCAIDLALSAVLIPRVGFIGGAWATLTSYAVETLIYVAAFQRVSGVPLGDLWRPRRGELVQYLRGARRLARPAWPPAIAVEPPAEPVRETP